MDPRNTARSDQASSSRRAAFRTIAGTGAAIVALVTVGQDDLGQPSTGEAVVTANLNLRSGPGTSHSILRVIPKGSTVTTCDTGQVGFLTVGYNGTTGYASAEYLAPPGSAPSPPQPSGTAKTTAGVDLRSGPSTTHQVLRVVPAGAPIATTETVQNGVRYVTHDGLPGWMSNQYLTWDLAESPSGGTFTTTADLRLRAEPGTSSRILLVMPAGSVVKALAGTAAGFRQVSYRGTTGWATTDDLDQGIRGSRSRKGRHLPDDREAVTPPGPVFRTPLHAAARRLAGWSLPSPCESNAFPPCIHRAQRSPHGDR